MKKNIIEELGFQTETTYFTGEEVVAYLEEMYSHDETAEMLYETLSWGQSIKHMKELKEIKIAMVKEYMGE